MPNPDRTANTVLNKRQRILPALQGVARTVAWALANLVAGGLICGSVIWLTRSPQPQQPPRPPDGEPSIIDAASANHDTESIGEVMTDSLPHGDDLLKSGDILGASRAYDRLIDQSPSPSETLRYRKAICLELLGDAEHALSEYQALADSSSNSGFVSAALFGQVRIQNQRNQLIAPRKLLFTMILTSGGREKTASSAFHHLAQLVAKETFAADVPLHDDRGITISNWNDDVGRLLQLPAELGGPESNSQRTDTVSILDRLGGNPSTIRVAVVQNDVPLARLLDHVSTLR